MLKGIFDKRVRIDLPVPLQVPTPPPPSPRPYPFPSHFPQENHPAHHPPEPDPKPLPSDTNKNSQPFAKTTRQNYPLAFCPEGLSNYSFETTVFADLWKLLAPSHTQTVTKPGAREGGRTLEMTCCCLLSASRKALLRTSSKKTLLRNPPPSEAHLKTPSKNPSWNLLESSLKNPSKNPS